uniref:Fatty acyl-CoA reductase n=1 Tax=Panagrolaimus sp. JU765 TaxID=591449 RepID=A0AC34QVW2_9BILA
MVTKKRVTEVFQNQTIFVTGFSGFLGKVLVEKLLFSTNVSKIYVLIRPLKGHKPQERLDKILTSPIYDRIRTTDDQIFKKLVPIAGDLMHENLGMSQQDIEELCQNVSIVFHCAATVKFDEILRVSVQMNLIGTRQLLAICHKMTKLISIVHASTAYANCDLSETEEKIYPLSITPKQMISAIEWMDDDTLKQLTPKLLGKRPNTYTLTKALAETQLVEDAKDLPVIIIRPSIIGAMWREPLPGWTDNVNGPTGIFAGVGKGVLTDMCGSNNAKADIIPVDIVSNMMIVAAAHRAQTHYTEIPVMHCASGTINPLKWERIVNYLQKMYLQNPLDECSRVPSTHFHSNRKLFVFNFYLKHYIPAHFVDFAYRTVGKKPRYVRMYQKIWKMIETLHFFTTRGWNFDTKNLLFLWNSIDDEDKKIFNFDVRQIIWDDYMFDYVMGIKVYLLKENIDNLPTARSNLAKLKQFSLYWNAFIWAMIVRFFAWKKTRTQKWAIWFAGFIGTYIYQNYDFRSPVTMKSLEDYKKSSALVKVFE